MIGYKQASKPASQQASKPASQQASEPLLCTVTNTAYARAYNKIFDISKPAYEIFFVSRFAFFDIE